MSLFQKSVIKKYVNGLDQGMVDEKYRTFQRYFGDGTRQENIRNSKEEQFQEGFFRELFVNILGYTLNPDPDYNLSTEFKNITGSKKADGAILKENKAVAVIELKSTLTTDLDTVETQAFGYKNHHPGCAYVITSNFEKLRFYIHNAVDYIEFDLFRLPRERFALLWLLLAKEQLLQDVPQEMKKASVLQEEDVTKKLYGDYSKFREELYHNLVHNNPGRDKLLLFRKTQKLLDRFLFIFFAEDKLLLPPNSISRIVQQWADLKDSYDEYFPLYHRFKKYFGYLNEGYKGRQYEIFPYNGGLFKPDEVLDTITVDDEALRKHTLRLSGYDFETDVDVNILGHIFEHSIGEIESVQAEIRGEAVDRQKTQRKKEGIFYTPKYITKYIVENTVGRLCEEKRQELGIVDEEYTKGRRHRKMATLKALNQKLDDYRVWLLSLTILDPACGSGAFLNQALDFLIKEHGKIDELRAELLGESLVLSDITNDILENNIYGVDLNEESVEIAKLSLWLRTAQKGRRLNTLSQNIKCGNSLIDDPAVAGNKAFNWQQEFPGVFKKKNKKAWHVTWVTHDTRTSERMKKYRVRERKASGEMHVDRSVILEENDALKVTEIIADIIIENNFNCLAYNICHDHVHILLVCEKEELPGIVRKLKGKSAQKFKEYLGISKEETYNLWAQKFNWKEIESDKQLENVIEYIKTNRERHELPNINEAEQSYNNEAQSSNNRPLEEKTRGCSPLSESSLLSNEQGTNDQNSHDMKDEKDLHSNGDENENHHHNKEPQSHNKESQPHNKEPQSHNKESQPHNKESQYHNKGSQSHNKESQSHNKESQSHNKESQPHNKEPQYHNKESQPHNKESQYHNKGLQPLVNRPNRPKQPLAIQHQQTLQSLIDKMTCSYSHAFRPEYMGGFDVIIGNPPYVRAELLGEIREHLEANYSVFNPSGDLFTYFYEKSFQILKPKTGLFGFISNTFNKTTAGVTLRQYLQNNVVFLKYVDFTEVQIFEGATTYPIILIAQNHFDSDNTFKYIKIPYPQKSKVIDIDLQVPVNVKQNTLNKENWSFKSIEAVNLISKTQNFDNIRNIYGKCYYGVKTALNDAFIIPEKYKTGEHVKPIYEGKELAKWKCPPIAQQLILFKSKWTKETYGNDLSEEEALEKVKNDFPELMKHILPFKERAKKRHDKGEFFWELRNCSYYDLFEKSKIVFPNLQSTNKFAFDETGAYVNAPAVFLPTGDKFLTAILNSQLIWYFLKNICVVRSGGYIEVKPQYFEQIPIADISGKNKEELMVNTDKVMDLTRERQNTDNKFTTLLSNHFTDIKINKKLQNWPQLEYKDFLKELKKQQVKLSLSEESEWMQYFNEQKQKANDLQTQITQTDREIDRMVYDLYGLTEEEIGIVEESVG